ncbi:heat shock protein transcriptional repressor HspR [Neoactinobaculum massilliense]|uniref:heat shock protein transcriptional repressor HspR n=1 Tax=Neoactinobaculum massilliense TaxID=2364794 RepID=UPI000F52F892|nr:MerR family transcriptional regulator [Neoactinobaculum massilliense]
MTARDAAVLTVSVAAELAGMHPQTVRQYDRLGLVKAHRTAGRGRRYSLRDVEKLQRVQKMSQDEGISLAGIARILELEGELERLQRTLERTRARLRAREAQLEAIDRRARRVFAAGPRGDVRVAETREELRELLRGGMDADAGAAGGVGGAAEASGADVASDVGGNFNAGRNANAGGRYRGGYAIRPLTHSTALVVWTER